MAIPAEVPAEHEGVWLALGIQLPWHAKLHALIVSGDLAVVLVDTNSDQREIERTIYRQAPDGKWHDVESQDDVDDPGMQPVELVGYAYGRSQLAEVTIVYDGAEHRLPVDSLGWWAFGAPTETGWEQRTIPRRVD